MKNRNEFYPIEDNNTLSIISQSLNLKNQK
jgi:hypothetical protein